MKLLPCLIALMCTLFGTHGAYAMTEAQVVKAVLGEARGCSAYEQEAIARATLNRGSLRGVYGYKAVLPTLGVKTRLRALNATKMAYKEDITKGATHWLSSWDLAHCRESLIAWRHSMIITLKTEHFTFYKERA